MLIPGEQAAKWAPLFVASLQPPYPIGRLIEVRRPNDKSISLCRRVRTPADIFHENSLPAYISVKGATLENGYVRACIKNCGFIALDCKEGTQTA